VAVIRLRSLGDCVLTTPALAILRGFRPDLHVVIVVENRFREIFEGNPDLDEILPPDLNRLRRARPNLCLNLHGGTRSAWMTALSGARYRAGFGHFRSQFVYNLRIPRAQQILGIERTVHTAEHLASAFFYLGAPRLEIPGAKLGTLSRDRKGSESGRAVVIHPVAAVPEKTWGAEGFLEVAHYLENSGSPPVFIGGETDDLSPFHAFRRVQGAPLTEIKYLLADAGLFIGNDSGPAHMAAAFGVPSVVLFGSSDPAIWGPWRTPGEVLTSAEGIAGIRPGQVIEAIARLRVHA
jgi:ADP-heptose:LPS heptosyltransferase